METDPQIGFDVDPHEQRRSETEQIERNADKSEGKAGTAEESSDTAGGSDERPAGGEADTAEDNGDKSAAEEKAAEEKDLYEPDNRETVVVPGSDGTLTGTAFADWVDDEGNLTEEHEGQEVPEADDVDWPDPEKLDELKDLDTEGKPKDQDGEPLTAGGQESEDTEDDEEVQSVDADGEAKTDRQPESTREN